MDNSQTAAYLNKVNDVLVSVEDWQAPHLEEKLRQLQQQLKIKPRPAFMTIRLAITGKTATPPLFDVMQILGKDEVVNRLSNAVNSLTK